MNTFTLSQIETFDQVYYIGETRRSSQILCRGAYEAAYRISIRQMFNTNLVGTLSVRYNLANKLAKKKEPLFTEYIEHIIIIMFLIRTVVHQDTFNAT